MYGIATFLIWIKPTVTMYNFCTVFLFHSETYQRVFAAYCNRTALFCQIFQDLCHTRTFYVGIRVCPYNINS